MNEERLINSARNKTNLKMNKPQINKLEKRIQNLVINTLIPKFKFENNKGEIIEIKDVNII